MKIARTADAIVAVIGTNESTSREAYADNHLGDMATLDLIGNQQELVDQLVATGKPVVVVLMNGRPLSITQVAAKVPAILEVWYQGQEGGTAIAEALFGDVNPGGKLPITVPRSVGQLPVYYNRKPTSFRNYLFESRAPLYPFGFGLSYTTFTLTDLKLADATIGPAGRTTASVTVTNTGTRAGDEVVQLYVHDVVASVTRPVKQLRGFQRVSLKPGESKVVTLPIGPEALWLIDQQMVAPRRAWRLRDPRRQQLQHDAEGDADGEVARLRRADGSREGTKTQSTKTYLKSFVPSCLRAFVSAVSPSQLASSHDGMRCATRRQCREIGERFGLIPVGGREEVVAAIVGVAVLHRVLQRALEGHRVVAVPAVAAVAAAGALGVDDERRAVHRVTERDRAVAAAEVPAPEEVVFAAGADDRRAWRRRRRRSSRRLRPTSRWRSAARRA